MWICLNETLCAEVKKQKLIKVKRMEKQYRIEWRRETAGCQTKKRWRRRCRRVGSARLVCERGLSKQDNAEREGRPRSNARAIQRLVHHCIKIRGRTHHVTKQTSEDPSRWPTTAMDHYFMKINSAVNAQTRSQATEHHEPSCVEQRYRRTMDIF